MLQIIGSSSHATIIYTLSLTTSNTHCTFNHLYLSLFALSLSILQETMKSRFLRGCLNKCKKMCLNKCISCEECCERAWWCCLHEGCSDIPSDVPKGHLVVYVGEKHKRYVIKIGLLHHPLFRALLDQAQEEYDFIADSKLCIPCDEHLFLSVLRCATSPQNQPVCLCL
ncbi:uncharacterized protein LOC106771770 [Vigna radiata var. radiata]|uniref:Uncharacterized protein LOC106771770 n=1 Tax=Vigna radiata var. radiata TaxID=3916 RepID=A0A1S3V4N3_VIGRR|nr:uncharacterized protein LOC106771770 [Vigna radiata var. radiata]